MSNYQQWAVLVGAMLPALVAFVQQKKLPTWARTALAAATSALAAVVTVWLQHGSLDLSATGWATTVFLVIGTAEVTYRLYWKPSTIAPKIEKATSPK